LFAVNGIDDAADLRDFRNRNADEPSMTTDHVFAFRYINSGCRAH
jgi:hypothetical protein